MGFFDLFRAKWKHSNPAIRAAAMRKLDDQSKLTKVFKTDCHRDVREAALRQISHRFASNNLSMDTLKEIVRALGDSNAEIRRIAINILERYGDCCIKASEGIPYWLKEAPDEFIDSVAKEMDIIVGLWCNWSEEHSWNEYFFEGKPCSDLKKNQVLAHLIGLLLNERDANFISICMSLEVNNYGEEIKQQQVYQKSLGPWLFCASGDHLGSGRGEFEWGEEVRGGDLYAEVTRHYVTLDIPAPFTEKISRDEILQRRKK